MIAKQVESVAGEANTSIVQQSYTSLWAATQFLTRLPTPQLAWEDATLPRALVFFPVIGLALGAAAGGVDLLLLGHLTHNIAALMTIALLVIVTGGLHEDGLADCADGFGLRHSKQRTLAILHDSRIGVYGALALVLSVGARILLLAALPAGRILPVVIAATTLSRWSILPLSFLPSANPGVGQGTSIAGRISLLVFALGTAVATVVVGCAVRLEAIPMVVLASVIVLLAAAFYRRRIGGVTGDCFGCDRATSRSRGVGLRSLDAMTLLFIRHAETNLIGTFCGSSDPPLNDQGRAQLPSLIVQLASFDIEQIFTSHLLRARQTADALAASIAVPVVDRVALREIHFGEWEGLTWAQIEQRDPSYATRWVTDFPALPAPGGEPITAFRHRVVTEISALRAMPQETIAIVTHAGVLRAVLEEFGHLAPEHAWERTRNYASVIRCTQRSPQGALEVHP